MPTHDQAREQAQSSEGREVTASRKSPPTRSVTSGLGLCPRVAWSHRPPSGPRAYPWHMSIGSHSRHMWEPRGRFGLWSAGDPFGLPGLMSAPGWARAPEIETSR